MMQSGYCELYGFWWSYMPLAFLYLGTRRYVYMRNRSINTDDNSTYKDLELGTIIFGDKVLYVYYRADTPSFSTFLPTALEMIGSLRINESVITEPVPSSSPSRSIITSTAATPCSQVYYIWWEYSYRCWT